MNKNNHDIASDQAVQNLYQRINKGRLPVIEIAGQEFIVNVRSGYLSPVDNYSTLGIQLKYVPDDAVKHQLLYDKKRKEEYAYDDAYGLPPEVIKIEIPGQGRLDPVGLARRDGLADTFYIGTYPLKMKMVAKIIPLKNKLEKKNTAKTVKRKLKGKRL